MEQLAVYRYLWSTSKMNPKKRLNRISAYLTDIRKEVDGRSFQWSWFAFCNQSPRLGKEASCPLSELNAPQVRRDRALPDRVRNAWPLGYKVRRQGVRSCSCELATLKNWDRLCTPSPPLNTSTLSPPSYSFFCVSESYQPMNSNGFKSTTGNNDL